MIGWCQQYHLIVEEWYGLKRWCDVVRVLDADISFTLGDDAINAVVGCLHQVNAYLRIAVVEGTKQHGKQRFTGSCTADNCDNFLQVRRACLTDIL